MADFPEHRGFRNGNTYLENVLQTMKWVRKKTENLCQKSHREQGSGVNHAANDRANAAMGSISILFAVLLKS
jgi:hypothetical protein